MTASGIAFNLTLPRYEDQGERDPFRQTYELARHVESVGFTGAFIGHHSFTPETKDPSAPFVLLAAIAARTEQLRLGTGVFLGALHHPITICEQVATLDQISGGRAVFGVGTGYRKYEFDAYGSPFETTWPAPQRDARDPPQHLDDGQLPARRRVLPLRRRQAVPTVRAEAPPADLRRRHVAGGDRASGSARRHVVHAADGDAGLRACARRPVPRGVRVGTARRRASA